MRVTIDNKSDARLEEVLTQVANMLRGNSTYSITQNLIVRRNPKEANAFVAENVAESKSVAKRHSAQGNYK